MVLSRKTVITTRQCRAVLPYFEAFPTSRFTGSRRISRQFSQNMTKVRGALGPFAFYYQVAELSKLLSSDHNPFGYLYSRQS